MDHELLISAFERTRLVGAAVSDYPYTPEWSVLDHHVHAVRNALDDSGLALSDVDGILMTGGWGGPDSAVGLSEYLGLRPRFLDGTDVGGSSYIYHAARAAFAVGSGLCDVAVVVHGELGRSGGYGHFSSPVGRGFGSFFWDSLAGIQTAGAYAMAAQRHMHEYGTTSEDLARIAVACRHHASMNPRAQYQDPITIDDVLNSRWIAEPLHLLDCCVVSDGGGAYVVTTKERARDLPKPAARMLGYGERVGHGGIGTMPDFTEVAGVDAARLAFLMAGLQPSDIDCAQLYDSFTITVLLELEALGFFPKGGGSEWLKENLTIGTPLPINTDGGGLSACHPGMRGVFLVIEALRQIRGEGDPRTVVKEGGVETCVAHGVGGYLSTHATLILGKDR